MKLNLWLKIRGLSLGNHCSGTERFLVGHYDAQQTPPTRRHSVLATLVLSSQRRSPQHSMHQANPPSSLSQEVQAVGLAGGCWQLQQLIHFPSIWAGLALLMVPEIQQETLQCLVQGLGMGIPVCIIPPQRCVCTRIATGRAGWLFMLQMTMPPVSPFLKLPLLLGV